MPSKGVAPPQGGDWGPLSEGALRALQPAVLCYRPPTPAPQSPNRHLPPRPLRATLQASYHCSLRGLRVGGDDLDAPTLIYGGVLEEGA